MTGLVVKLVCQSLSLLRASARAGRVREIVVGRYLQAKRKQLALSQEEVGFLLGLNGMNKGNKVCRDETFAREPSLLDALAYEVIYGRPVSELFAGLHHQAQQRVASRAKVLSVRKSRKSDTRRQQNIIQLAKSASVNPNI